MKKLILMAFLWSLPWVSSAAPIDDYSWEAGFYLTTLGDYLQTRQIIRNPSLIEKNPILGLHPKLSQVNDFFLIQFIVGTLFQQTQYRRSWNITMTTAHGLAILNNYKVGVEIRF